MNHVQSVLTVLWIAGVSTLGACATAPGTAVMSKDAQSAMSPGGALTALMEGNERFVSQQMLTRNFVYQVHTTSRGQYPFAVVLGCIDSRVPPELVFDQGIGDIFSGRVAGNFVDTDLLGSFEFATRLSGSKLIVVLGHTECGAIKGACDGAQLGNLTETLANLMPAVQATTHIPGTADSSNKEFVQAVAEENVRLTVKAMIERSPVMEELEKAGELLVVGAMYDVASGRVTLLD